MYTNLHKLHEKSHKQIIYELSQTHIILVTNTLINNNIYICN